jgi:hypothetical protein
MTSVDDPAQSTGRPDRPRLLAARNLFVADGVLGLIFALGFLVLTPQLLSLYGIGVSAGSVLMTRLVAGFLLAAGVTQLTARRHADSPAGRSLTLGCLATKAVGAVISAIAVVRGDANLFALVFVALFLAEGAWRSYLILRIYRLQLAPDAAGS